MPEDLYDRDVLAWSEHQATFPRRVARGERVNDIDWTHVVEEIGGRGVVRIERGAFVSAANRCPSPQAPWMAYPHGLPPLRSEIVAFQTDAQRRFAPSMRQRIDLDAIYARAVPQIEPLRYGGQPSPPLPGTCPVTIEALLTASCSRLEAAFPAA